MNTAMACRMWVYRMVCVAISVLGLSMFISFVGAFACSLLAFILPAARNLVFLGSKLSLHQTTESELPRTLLMACRMWVYRIVRVAMVSLVGAIAVSVPGFSMFISFVGSFACSSLAFILPAACHLVLFGPKLPWASRAMDYALILFGVMGMVFGVAHSIGLMIASKGHE
jgi:hypothetical protein